VALEGCVREPGRAPEDRPAERGVALEGRCVERGVTLEDRVLERGVALEGRCVEAGRLEDRPAVLVRRGVENVPEQLAAELGAARVDGTLVADPFDLGVEGGRVLPLRVGQAQGDGGQLDAVAAGVPAREPRDRSAASHAAPSLVAYRGAVHACLRSWHPCRRGDQRPSLNLPASPRGR
jgi:hypothetical protein